MIGIEYRAVRRVEPLVSGIYAITRLFELRRDPGIDLEGIVSELL